MIHYQLRCAHGHEFDGWFRDSASFDEQAAGGLLACPACGGTEVGRALMAPSLPRKGRELVTVKPAEAATPVVEAGMPDAVRALLQRMRADVERECDYVGDQFAEEARRMHRGVTEKRGIYGETSPEQAEALAEEGIEFGRLPWVQRAES